jgi:AcrR family transcriptional regulator
MAIMNGFERRAENKKTGIRTAAMKLFAQYGVKKVSIREIAEAANVSQVSIYNYFGNKSGLIRDVVETIVLTKLDAVRTLIAGDQSFPEKLEQIILAKAESSEIFKGEFIQSLLIQAPEAVDVLENVYQRDVRSLMDELFKLGRATGYIDTELSQDAITGYVEIFRSGTQAQAAAISGSDRNPMVLQEVIRMFFRGMSPPVV